LPPERYWFFGFTYPIERTLLRKALGVKRKGGADMLKPLAIAVIGALCISVLLSLVATPVAYYLMLRLRGDGVTGRKQSSGGKLPV